MHKAVDYCLTLILNPFPGPIPHDASLFTPHKLQSIAPFLKGAFLLTGSKQLSTSEVLIGMTEAGGRTRRTA